MADAPAPVTQPDATATPPVAPKAPSKWDSVVAAVAKPWAVIGARQQTEKEKARAGGSLAGFTVNPLGATLRAAPNMVRPGSLGATDYSNRPTIQVLSDTDATSHTSAPSFSDFILTNVSGGDAEKAEVVETFGIPHVFTSGRFMRRYTFNVSVRTTLTARAGPIKLARGGGAIPFGGGVSHYAAFLRFYDDFLRVTKQAETGRFTRITVDGEVYDGWVTSMTPLRDSGAEGFATITFTMVVRDRAHPGQAAELTRYLKPFAAAPRITAPKRRAQLNAELIAATGANEMNTTVLAAPTVTANGFYGVLTVALKTPGPLRVAGEIVGATVTFDGGQDSTVLNAEQTATVGVTVTDATKFVGGSLAVTLTAGVTKKVVNVSIKADVPRTDPGRVGAVLLANPPTQIADVTAFAELPYSVFVNDRLDMRLTFEKPVPTTNSPDVTGSDDATVRLSDVSAREARLSLTLSSAMGAKLAASKGSTGSAAVTIAASGGAFRLPTFTIKILNADGKPAVAKPITEFSAVLTESGRGNATNLVFDLRYTFDPAVTDFDFLSRASVRVSLKTLRYATIDPAMAFTSHAPVVIPLMGASRSMGLDTRSATFRLLAPVLNGGTGFQSCIVFFEGEDRVARSGLFQFEVVLPQGLTPPPPSDV